MTAFGYFRRVRISMAISAPRDSCPLKRIRPSGSVVCVGGLAMSWRRVARQSSSGASGLSISSMMHVWV